MGRKSSVFPTPVRAAVLGDDLAGGQRREPPATGKGLSHQGFNLCRKIAEVDAWVRGGAGVPVLEVHPEVSFAAMGADTVPSKKTAEGRATRLGRAAGRRAAAAGGPARTPAYDVDDAARRVRGGLDGRRHLRGESRSLPEVPERFSDGLAAAIHV